MKLLTTSRYFILETHNSCRLFWKFPSSFLKIPVVFSENSCRLFWKFLSSFLKMPVVFSENSCRLFWKFLSSFLKIRLWDWRNNSHTRNSLKWILESMKYRLIFYKWFTNYKPFLHSYIIACGVSVGAFGWDTALHAGRTRVRFPILSLGFFIDLILLVALWHWSRLSR